jgi:hypothetical protein
MRQMMIIVNAPIAIHLLKKNRVNRDQIIVIKKNVKMARMGKME